MTNYAQRQDYRDPNDIGIGEVIGGLAVIHGPIAGASGTFFTCMCLVCNNPTVIRFGLLTPDRVSCGCSRGNYTHRGSRTRLYTIWCGMRFRCNNPKATQYKDYGGRGIRVCVEWDDFLVFKTWAERSGYSDELSLDRIDNNKGYEPDNCRWATRKQQNTNRRSTMALEWDGVTKSLADWVQDPRCVVGYATAYQRLRLGWKISDALSKPARKRS